MQKMKYTISEATEQEKKDILVYMMKDYIEITNITFGEEKDEIDTYFLFKNNIVSIRKIEIEVNGITKTIYNTIYLNQDESLCVFFHSAFYKLVDNKFTDISNNDFIQF